jgi:OOP family OmpA-OmpF porin
MKTMFLRLFMSALCLCLICLPALTGNAATRAKKDYSLSPMIGGYVFEGDQDLEDDLTYSLGLGYNLTDSWSTEFVLNYFNTDFKRSQGGGSADGLLYHLDTLYHFMPESSLVPYLAGGFGGMTIDPDRGSSETDFLINYGIGLKYFFTDSLALRGDLRHVFAFGDPNNNFIYSAGLTYLFGSQQKPVTRVEPKDSDGDGVIDANDACPGTPAGVPVNRLGCPLDSDRDGVPDYRDKCPNTPKSTPVNKQGCALDTDGDGVSNKADKCPGTPQGMTVDERGCTMDSDGDGIADQADKCPGTPAGLMVNKKGCPISLTLAIEFDVDKADIKQRYHAELKRGADFIRKYPASRILIAGHTDSTASDAYNLGLSQRRAESIRNYLIRNFGIKAERLQAKGYGETFPIADNATAQGRQRNRRVELSVYALNKK